MIKKLLLVIFAFISFNAFSQATAFPVGDLQQCNNEVFDLTIQEPQVLGNQNPAMFTVDYFLTMTDAMANMNPIMNPMSYVGGMSEVIYIRVTNNQDDSFDVTNFTISWDFGQPVGPYPDVTVCDSYILPTLPAGEHYYTMPNGQGTMLAAGMEITVTMDIYVWSENSCETGTGFTIVVLPTPNAPTANDVTVCDSYVLPALPQGNYFTGPQGSGTMIPVGNVITSTQTIYIYVLNGMCSDESSFTVTVFSSPMDYFATVYSCTAYTLPPLPAGYQYTFNGMTIPVGTVISETTTISVSGESGTIPNCISQQDLVINIGSPIITLESLQGCDYNDDGIGEFTLIEGIPGELLNSSAQISFYETLADAETEINQILGNSYVNIVPMQQTLYVRFEFPGGCYTVTSLQLITVNCSNSTISGVVSLDTENNGCAGDPGYANAHVVLANGSDVLTAYTNSLGQYQFSGVLPGTYQVSIVGLPAYLSASAPQTVVTSGNSDADIANFCITGPTAVSDAQLTVSSWTAPIPGFSMMYYITVYNMGTTNLSGTVTFTYDNSMMSFSGASPAQSGQNANTITFNYTNLAPAQTIYYQLNFMMFTPPTVQSGDILNISATTVTNPTDSNLANNTMEMQNMVVNSYDPNDISVHEGEFITEVQADGYLHYTIRFQNQGTAPAQNVRLENSLDPNLDWSTFMPLASSHNYFAVRDGGNLTFRFNGIMLPAEQDNEPASHGYITYKIKPAANFSIGDIISNGADIYFDFNPAITTNTVTTQIEQLSVPGHDVSMLKMYPNPASEYAVLRGFEGSVNVVMYDLQGKMIKSATLTDNQPLNVSDVQAGMYFLKIEAHGKVVVKKLMVDRKRG